MLSDIIKYNRVTFNQKKGISLWEHSHEFSGTSIHITQRSLHLCTSVMLIKGAGLKVVVASMKVNHLNVCDLAASCQVEGVCCSLYKF